MSRVKRLGLLLGAVVALTAAALLVSWAGLPERSAYTGQILPDEGWVAPEIGAAAPPFERLTLTDQNLNLRHLRGKPVIINFWATWCGPCVAEMPALQAVYDRYEAEGLRIIAVNMGESRQTVQDWVTEMGLTFDIVLDENGAVTRLYWLRVQPTTFIISPEGIITAIFYGQTTEQAVTDALIPFLYRE